MCGRFTLTTSPEQLRAALSWLTVPDDLPPRYNIAPSQPVAVVANDGKNFLDYYVWGLIPAWAKDHTIGNRLINARAETVAEKPAFRTAFQRRRCLVLADGFYEWQSHPGSKSKIPMYIKLTSGKPFALAGLWENWNSPDGSTIRSCTIITTEPNRLMQPIHNRMPVILPDEAFPSWLSTESQPPAVLQALLKPYPADEMVAYPVSNLVNNPANELPDCITPYG